MCAILYHEMNISEETFRILQTEGGGVSGESHVGMGAEGARFDTESLRQKDRAVNRDK